MTAPDGDERAAPAPAAQGRGAGQPGLAAAAADGAADDAAAGLGRLGPLLEPWIARALPWVIRRSLRRGLRGVWVRGADAAQRALRDGGVLVPNHHAWWDGYLLWLVWRRLDLDGAVLVRPTTLATYPYFTRIGAIPSHDVRRALRRLRDGAALGVYAEGEQRAPGPLGPLERGAAFLARVGGRELHPLAVRVRLRGAQHPEAFLDFGPPLSASADDAETTARLARALGARLADLDATLDATALDAVPSGFVPWLGGSRSADERTSWLARLWNG